MEWTVVKHTFATMPDFYMVSRTVVDPNGWVPDQKHNIMVDFVPRQHGWRVRDAVDISEFRHSLLEAFQSYIEISRRKNRHGIGHCEWMMETGLPSLEEELGDVITLILVQDMPTGSVN